MKIKLNQDWKWDTELDQYENQNTGFIISGAVIAEEMENWGRPIRNVHILAVLDKLNKIYSGKQVTN